MKPHIIQIGHPKLRAPTLPLSKSEILSDQTQQLISTMCEAMRAAPGVGLAAPQIAQSLKIIVIEDKAEYTKDVPKQQLLLREREPIPYHVLINPKIISEQTNGIEFFEGCLSIEGLITVVPRWLEVSVECYNEKAELVTINARGWYARILQHEIDHLNGILCIDRMKIRTLMTIDNYVTHWKDKPVEETCKSLEA